MNPEEVNHNIRELEKVRKETALWRIGGTVAVVLIVGGCLLLLTASVNNLVKPGPGQETYVTEVREGLNKDIVPRLQQTASQTLTEMQPVVQREFQGLNARVPELTQASMKELETLQASIPARGEKIFNETFGNALKGQEAEIKTMFPNATEEQVTALMTNLGNMANERGGKIADEILTPHTNRMRRIVENLRAIEGSEKPTPGGRDGDWEMGLAVFDIVREDMKDMVPPEMNAEAKKRVGEIADSVADAAKKVSEESKK